MATKKSTDAAGKSEASKPAAATAEKKVRMTQTEIVNHLADKSGLKKQQAKDFMNELANLAMSEVNKNGEFTLPGFGKLVLSERKEREGRNPATGQPIKIPAKTTLKFRLGKAMKEGVSGDSNGGKADPKKK